MFSVTSSRVASPQRSLAVLIAASAVIAAVFTAVDTGTPAAAATVPTSANLVANGGFESGLKGWRTNGRTQKLRKATAARSGTKAARLASSKAKGRVVLNDRPNATRTTRAKQKYRLTAWVRTNRPGITGQLKIRAVKGRSVQRLSKRFTLTDKKWKRVVVEGTVRRKGASLDLNLLGWKLQRGARLLVDDVELVKVKTVNKTNPDRKIRPEPEDPAGTLTNGCSYSARGIPTCGAYVGATHYVGSTGNADPSAWESQLGRQLGVRRMFFQSNQVDGAVRRATDDAAAKRVSWISFKAPYSWAEMAAGRGDAWARDTAARLAKVPGPVWVAVHHEPENDAGRFADWTKMQARLAPIFRSAGSNVAFSIILMGYHQFYGADELSLENLWPKSTKVDVAGFDIYDSYGVERSGTVRTKHVDFRNDYFEKIEAWASKAGVAWGLAETGFTAEGFAKTPSLMSTVYRDLVDHGGIAYAYFDAVGTTADWALSDAARRNGFAAIHRQSPTMK